MMRTSVLSIYSDWLGRAATVNPNYPAPFRKTAVDEITLARMSEESIDTANPLELDLPSEMASDR